MHIVIRDQPPKERYYYTVAYTQFISLYCTQLRIFYLHTYLERDKRLMAAVKCVHEKQFLLHAHSLHSSGYKWNGAGWFKLNMEGICFPSLATVNHISDVHVYMEGIQWSPLT